MGKKKDKLADEIFGFGLRMSVALAKTDVKVLAVGGDGKKERKKAEREAEVASEAFADGARIALAAVAAWVASDMPDLSERDFVTGLYERWAEIMNNRVEEAEDAE